jgi:decaprenylphospho-beta-D-ribofuranose 2-oxidase
MDKKWILIVLLFYITAICSSAFAYKHKLSHPVVVDIGHLLPVSIKTIQTASGEKQLRALIKRANITGDKISIAGMQHSQGGHTYYPNSILIDMKKYNKIIDFKPEKKLITVQSGATWDDIQRHINPYGLAVKVMQSQNIFTVGGSLSVNVHGRDIRYGSLIDSIESFRLLNAQGDILNVSRTENPELFQLAIGGYGLFGVILDATIKLTDDELYRLRTKTIDYKEYTAYFKEQVKETKQVKMHLARISVAPESFLKEMYVTDYVEIKNDELLKSHQKLKQDRVIAIPKFFLGLSRHSNWGKNLFWDLQKTNTKKSNGTYESRNNVMRSGSAFMEYENEDKTEVLQEYFIPLNEFSSYIDGLRTVLKSEKDFNLLNITIRYVSKNDHAYMSYSKDDMFALVLLINQGRSADETEKTKKIVNKMINLTLRHKGSYYLPYYSYPTKEQLREAYPRAEHFFQLKRQYDPEERFVNLFYEEYGK